MNNKHRVKMGLIILFLLPLVSLYIIENGIVTMILCEFEFFTSFLLYYTILLVACSIVHFLFPLIIRIAKKQRLSYKTGKRICLTNSIVLLLLALVPFSIYIINYNSMHTLNHTEEYMLKDFIPRLYIAAIVTAIGYYFINMYLFANGNDSENTLANVIKRPNVKAIILLAFVPVMSFMMLYDAIIEMPYEFPHMIFDIIQIVVLVTIVSLCALIVPCILKIVRKEKFELGTGKFVCFINSLVLTALFLIPNVLTHEYAPSLNEIPERIALLSIILPIIYYHINMNLFVDVDHYETNMRQGDSPLVSL